MLAFIAKTLCRSEADITVVSMVSGLVPGVWNSRAHYFVSFVH